MALVQIRQYRTVLAKSFKTHRDLTSFPFIRRAQPCEQDGFAREVRLPP